MLHEAAEQVRSSRSCMVGIGPTNFEVSLFRRTLDAHLSSLVRLCQLFRSFYQHGFRPGPDLEEKLLRSSGSWTKSEQAIGSVRGDRAQRFPANRPRWIGFKRSQEDHRQR